MKTKSIVLILIIAVASVLGVVSYNAFQTPRSFKVLFNDKYDFCLLVDNRYQLKIKEDEIRYSGGKNSGLLTLENRSLSDKVHQVNINGFKSGYRKVKNLRIYEYKLTENFILRDEFVYAAKMPVNLVPYRMECSSIKKNYKNHIKIF